MTTSSLFPNLRGRLKANAPLGQRSWFRTGGQAEWLCTPKDSDDLQYILQQRPKDMPVTILGACSNVIIRDGGVKGLTLRLAGGFAESLRDSDGLIVGAAALDVTIAETAAQQGLAGMEFLAGIPGSIGGAVAMNAGAYGNDIAHILDWIDIVTATGDLVRLSAHALSMRYRHTELPEGAVIVRARLKGSPDSSYAINERIQTIRTSRENSQPLRTRTGGSTFRNPDGHKAWELIDQAGCRGLKIGDAQMSEKHCNFMLNLGQASSTDLENLGDTVRQRVFNTSGIILEWEIKRVGHPVKEISTS